jgi:hypothetical protein
MANLRVPFLDYSTSIVIRNLRDWNCLIAARMAALSRTERLR